VVREGHSDIQILSLSNKQTNKQAKNNPKLLGAYLTIKTSASQKKTHVSLHYLDVKNAFYYIT